MNNKDVPKYSFVTRLKFALTWDYRFCVLQRRYSELIEHTLESFLTVVLGLLYLIYDVFVLVFEIFYWLLSPIFMVIFKPRSVDKLIAMKLNPNQK